MNGASRSQRRWRRPATLTPLSTTGVLAFWLAPCALHAQSVAIEENERAPAAAASATAQPPKSPARPLRAPIAIATPVAYPETEQRTSDVVLELTISKTGSVSAVRAISGEQPFAERAVEAAKAWTFHPATREGVAIAARVRFEVHFTPPIAADTSARPNLPPGREPMSQIDAARQKEHAPEPPEVVVRGVREPLRKQLGRADIHDMPGAFGDPYRAIESLPGVVPIASGLPYFYVRGAPPGNVGYFFDGIPVPYLYHFAAGPGVLHPAFVDHVELYPAAYPARFGRFTGAIVAGELAPAARRFGGEASIRLVDSGAMLEAPFANQRGSFMLAGRYSYTGLVLSLFEPDVSLNYWDYQGRIRYDVSPHDSVELLAFGAGDFLSTMDLNSAPPTFNPDGTRKPRPEQRERNVVDIDFHRVDARWDHRFSGGSWRNAVLVGWDRTGGDDGAIAATDRLLGARSEYERTLAAGLELRAGGDILFESLAQRVNGSARDAVSPERDLPAGEANPDAASEDTADPDFGFDRERKDLSAALRADLVWDVSERVQVTPGLRADLYVSGPRSRLALDPRISARYTLSSKLSLTHGLAFVHQAPSFVAPVPAFKPSLRGGLQSALQHGVGINYELPAGFEASLSLFQNAFFNLTDLISLVQLQNAAGSDDTRLRSLGHAYGVELMLRRSLARDLGGFLAYTLSRSLRSSGRLRGPATTDRTHVLNAGVSYNLGRNWRAGGRVVLYSGIPVRVAYLEAAAAPPRTPPFWRLDVKLQKRWTIVPQRAYWGLVLEVLNTTLNKEVLSGECNAFYCSYEDIGPVTVPSVGVEGAF